VLTVTRLDRATRAERTIRAAASCHQRNTSVSARDGVLKPRVGQGTTVTGQVAAHQLMPANDESGAAFVDAPPTIAVHLAGHGRALTNPRLQDTSRALTEVLR